MCKLKVSDIITEIEETFIDYGTFFEVTNVTQEEVKNDLKYQDGFKMLTNEYTKDTTFCVEINESKFLNDKNYEKEWFKIAYGEIVAYVCLRCDNNDVNISALEVCENYRNEGYGGIIVKAIETYSKKNGIEKIYVSAFDSSAESFWKHIGFVEDNNGYLYKEV